MAFFIVLSLIILNVINIRFLPIFFIDNAIFSHVRNYISLISTYQIGSIFTLVAAISIFYFFKNLNIKNNKFINFIASTTFGCYLIHDNTVIRPFLWKNLFDMNIVMVGNLKSLFLSDAFVINKILAIPMVFISDIFNLPIHFLLPLHCFLIIIFILAVCSIIEFIRTNFIEKIIIKLVDKCNNISILLCKFDKWINE